jgi:hypothetical protein
MPTFTMRWANRSNPGAEQDWILGGIVHENFTLAPDYVASGQLTINANGTVQIAVNSQHHFAAATLTYTAVGNHWALASNTPNEFQLAAGGNIVTVRCLLNDAAARPPYEAYEAMPTRLEPSDPA